MRLPALTLVLAITATASLSAAPPRFERDVLPILARHCHACHGDREPKRGLDLRSITTLVEGGLSGLIAVPGKPEQSYLLHMVRREAMPPRGRKKLTTQEIKTLEAWISGGMLADTPYTIPQPPDPVSDDDRSHWAYRTLARPKVPPVANPHAVITPIDAFIQARLESAGLSLAEEADRRTLLRRLVLDLLGRPPTIAEQDRFLADTRPGAWARQVDTTLASPEFGQRFGRHWLDVAGYADTIGFDHVPTQVIITEGKWRYRDYVIQAFNNDHPLDRFLQEQLAGDEMVDWRDAKTYSPETVRHLVATGFLRTARDQTHEGVGVITPNYYEVLFETIDVVAGGLMGLSVKCARCHDHKFDAIPQRDYYRLMASLITAYNPTDWRPVYRFAKDINERSLLDVTTETKKQIDADNAKLNSQIATARKLIDAARQAARTRVLEKKRATVPSEIRSDVITAIGTDGKKRNEVQKFLAKRFEKLLAVSDDETAAALAESERTTIAEAGQRIADLESRKRTYGRVQALFDVGKAPTTFVLTRGDYRYPAAPVEPGYLSVLCDTPEEVVMQPAVVQGASSGRRLALARWLTRPGTRASALVTRVLVNRFWQAVFGRGLVRSSGDFGVQGTPPSHPLLLDWLAGELQRHNWQVKPLLRLMLVSAAYRQTSRPARGPRWATAVRIDPGNRLLWRMPVRRLESEAIRDSLLAVADRLDRSIGGPPVPQAAHSDGSITINTSALKRPLDRWRRSVYMVTRRGYSITLLQVFDQPSILTTCSNRESSAVPLQSLTMINGPFVNGIADRISGQVIESNGGSADAAHFEPILRAIYRRILCREPDDQEIRLCRAAWDENRATIVASGTSEPEARRQAVVELCHTVLNTSEFLYRE
jgi:hypothetical protein